MLKLINLFESSFRSCWCHKTSLCEGYFKVLMTRFLTLYSVKCKHQQIVRFALSKQDTCDVRKMAAPWNFGLISFGKGFQICKHEIQVFGF